VKESFILSHKVKEGLTDEMTFGLFHIDRRASDKSLRYRIEKDFCDSFWHTLLKASPKVVVK
jgi:hypothetical protein